MVPWAHLESGDAWREVGRTRAWCWQQGCTDFRRLDDMRPGYGYTASPTPIARCWRAEDAGTYTLDLTAGAEAELIISVAHVAALGSARRPPLGPTLLGGEQVLPPERLRRMVAVRVPGVVCGAGVRQHWSTRYGQLGGCRAKSSVAVPPSVTVTSWVCLPSSSCQISTW